MPGLEALPSPPPLSRPPPSALAQAVDGALRRSRAAFQTLRTLPSLLWSVAVARAVAQLAGAGPLANRPRGPRAGGDKAR